MYRPGFEAFRRALRRGIVLLGVCTAPSFQAPQADDGAAGTARARRERDPSLDTSARPTGEIDAYDPSLHVTPPMARYPDGSSGRLRWNRAWYEAADRQPVRAAPVPLEAAGDVTRVGEVLVVEDDGTILTTTDNRTFALARDGTAALTRKVIAAAGDMFPVITIWQGFRDPASNALAYALTVKNDVEGLGTGMPLRDMSAAYGSQGVLRTVVNMKDLAERAADDRQSWQFNLETWGQETGHRWMAFMRIIDPRTGLLSDALLGRDCAHYHRLVDTQASVQDGFAWRDNGDGSFTFTESTQRYGDLDLYGMGLMPADEVPPFFLIDDVPGYTRGACSTYEENPPPAARTVRGRKVPITIADIIAANGERFPEKDSDAGYMREAQVLLLPTGSNAQSTYAQNLARRIDRARLWWEEWALENSRKRLVVCTKSSGDCGDPRSDVASIAFNPEGRAPGQGPISVDVTIANAGGRAATGINARLRLEVGATNVGEVAARAIKDLAPGQQLSERFSLDLSAVPCGSEVTVSAWTQSDFHYDRQRLSQPLAVEPRVTEAFEIDSGWTVNPDGDDTTKGSVWERGPLQAGQVFQRQVQPARAHGGVAAFATGIGGGNSNFTSAGKTTLQSPPYDASTLRDPILRYWLSFAAMQANSSNTDVEPSEDAYLLVQARSLTGAGGAVVSPWVDVDVVKKLITSGWVIRVAAIPSGLDLSGQIQLRFVAADDKPMGGGVEAALDDIVLTSNLPACYQPATLPSEDGEGCGCRLGRAAPSSRGGAFGWLLGLGLLLAVCRRRRGR
jgi:hypothetical protein